MKINKVLGIAVAVLLLISAFSYRESVTRAERFERGQKFLPHLNPDEIAEIVITKGEDVTRLRRNDDEFVIVDANGYPAKNDAVNRFVKQVLEISLEKRVGAGATLEQELGLTAGGEDTVDVIFEDSNEKTMVQFLIGKPFDDGNGSYVRRVDVEESEIYLTGKIVYLSSGHDDFLKKEILNIAQTEIAGIKGPDYVVEDQDGVLQLAGVPSGKKENATRMGQIKAGLTTLRFDKHYLADDPELASLRFDSAVTFDLRDESGYQVVVATRDDKHYVKIRGFHKVQEISVAPDDDEEVVKEKSEILARADEIQKFNAFHGSWIYEVSETIAGKIRLTRSDLLEDA
jgi:hypothetical protein